MILYALIGLVAGILAGMFGIGGGVVIVPGLLLLAKMGPETASGTSLAALLLPVGALGAWEYYRRGHVHIAAALLISLGLLVGAAIGAHTALQAPPRTLQRAFAVFLALLSVHLWWKA
jgi:uncharacterized membrane protein YfcA